MKKSIIILCLFLLFNPAINAEENKISIEITQCVPTPKYLIYTLVVKNISEKRIVCYISTDKEDICSNVLSYDIIDIQENDTLWYYPCRVGSDRRLIYILDRGAIDLTPENSVSLNPGETYSRKYRIIKKEIFPRLRKNRYYTIAVEWNHNLLELNTPNPDFYKKNIVSNAFKFRNK